MGTSKTVKGIFFPSSRLDAPSNEIYLSGLSLMFSFAPMKKLKDFSFKKHFENSLFLQYMHI